MRLSNKGFTLAELMVASAILVTVIVGILALSVSCLLLNETNNNLVTAANDAQYVLEQIKSLDYGAIPSYSAPALTNLEDELISVSVSADTWVTGVIVDVTWTERQRSRSFQLQTSISP